LPLLRNMISLKSSFVNYYSKNCCFPPNGYQSPNFSYSIKIALHKARKACHLILNPIAIRIVILQVSPDPIAIGL